MFKRKSFLEIVNCIRRSGQGGNLSQEPESINCAPENEDDLLLEELYKFAGKNVPNVLGNEKVTVDDQHYYIMFDPKDGYILSLRKFIKEYYPRGNRLIFGKGIVLYTCVAIYNDGLEIGIIDYDAYHNHVANGITLSLDQKTREITEGKFQVYENGDLSTDCGG